MCSGGNAMAVFTWSGQGVWGSADASLNPALHGAACGCSTQRALLRLLSHVALLAPDLSS